LTASLSESASPRKTTFPDGSSIQLATPLKPITRFDPARSLSTRIP
jgi:hypothetical protein